MIVYELGRRAAPRCRGDLADPTHAAATAALDVIFDSLGSKVAEYYRQYNFTDGRDAFRQGAPLLRTPQHAAPYESCRATAAGC
jgi:hypothetical protein